MTAANYVFYRCVNLSNKKWFRIGIEFLHNKSSNPVVRITNNYGKLCASSFAPFQSDLIIYKVTKAGLRCMDLRNEAEGFFLRETQESLTHSQFYMKHRLDLSRGLFSSKWHPRKQSAFTPFRKSTMSALMSRRKLKTNSKNKHGEVLEHGFTPIDVSRSQEDWYPFDSASFEMELRDSSTQRKIAMLDSSSDEELREFGNRIKFRAVTSPRGVLRHSESPSKGYNVRFKQEADSSTCKRSGICTFWLKACMAPLGAWGLAVLLLGLVGVALATQGSVVFYAAATMTITGAAAIGMSLFRVNRNEFLQQRNEKQGPGSAAPALFPV